MALPNTRWPFIKSHAVCIAVEETWLTLPIPFKDSLSAFNSGEVAVAGTARSNVSSRRRISLTLSSDSSYQTLMPGFAMR